MSLVALGLEASVLDASGGKAASFSALVLGGGNPVDSGVTGDGLVVGVNHDDLEELVGSILTNPVGVEDAQVGTTTADTLLSDVLVGLLLLELADTVVDGLTENDTLADVSLAATTEYTGAVDHEALLGLVTQSARLIGAGRT